MVEKETHDMDVHMTAVAAAIRSAVQINGGHTEAARDSECAVALVALHTAVIGIAIRVAAFDPDFDRDEFVAACGTVAKEEGR